MGKTIQMHGFPYCLRADGVMRFLEEYTGKGTIECLEVWQSKEGKAHSKVQFMNAKVQFVDANDAEHIIFLTNRPQRLWYESFYLKARAVDSDMIRRPKIYVEIIDCITLHIGCQISKWKFSVLWERENVSVKFGFGLRKMYFFLYDLAVQYKLELSYENIWQTELFCRPHDSAKFLLIQLFGAPRIYKNAKGSDSSYFKEIPDDQWLRTTDFTPSCAIGQSSALCLELPHGVLLPKFSDMFAYYGESECHFVLERGASFSKNLALVPIVGSPQGLELPFKILFKICSLVQHGCLPGPSLDTTFFRLVDPLRIDIALIEHALQKLYRLKNCCYEPAQWLSKEYRKCIMSGKLPKPPAVILDAGLVYVHRVQITPCKVYFCGPEVNMSNRVLRNYRDDIDNFLRVSFIDEEFDKMFSTDLSPRVASASGERRTGLYKRILSILKNGIVIGNKKFEFLAFSPSQLRDNSVWMFASRTGLTAPEIRSWMGDFRQIRNVAKYAARLGQSFSSSTETLTVGRHEIEIIPDIEVVTGGVKYDFSDGIGKISEKFARSVAIKCGLQSYTPSAFQIRYGGYKGVVAIDPSSPAKLSLRMSMSKYESENTKLDVLAWSKPQFCFLNRQFITLLSTLGVKDHVFEKKQSKVVDQLDAILIDPLSAQEALDLMSSGENSNILKEMLFCGYKPDAEPFLSMILQIFRASRLLDLRTKTRILIPSGRLMMGCLDETRTLEYGQVFVQYSNAPHRQFYDGSSSMFNECGSNQQNFIIVERSVVVAKNPCLHPGDVRVLSAVDVPTLHHMVDCVVFPQKGKRPHTNECSGSDLDGDLYFVCWDPDLIPPKEFDPMDYTPAPNTLLDHDVTIEEVEEYFTNYIVNDSLGIISNAHLVFADTEPGKAMSNPCLELARLHSIAVDFPKTGVPAEIPSRLRVKEYPDFLEKPDKPTYESRSVIGKLFRKVRDIAPHECSIKAFTKEVAMQAYDPDMEVDGFKDYIDDAFDYKMEYDYKLGNLMDYYDIKTEAEILSGNVVNKSRAFNRKRDADAISFAMRSLRKEARTWFNKSRSDQSKSNGGDNEYAKASAWYFVTYHHSYWGRYNQEMIQDHFLSFPWCVHDKLIHIKKEKLSVRRGFGLPSLERLSLS